MKSRLILVHALSPLHASTGRALGAIDLPIARERPTGIPLLPGSSIKGALRARCKDSQWQKEIFGPETANSSDDSGSVQFSDVLLMLLPVRSLAGTFAWVTSSYLLQRFTRTAREVGLTVPSPPTFNLGKGACGVIGDTLKAGNKVILEDLDFIPDIEGLDSKAPRNSFANWLAERLFPNRIDGASWQEYFRQRFCLVHDNIMSYLLETAVEVSARIRLDDNAKTVADGGLWYEEALPSESILAGLAVASDTKAFKDRSTRSAEDLLKHISSLTGGLVQLGGKATTGHGACAVHVVGEAVMTLEQQRAAMAHKHVSKVKEKGELERKSYSSMVLELPVLIRTAGLCQALHFAHSRKKEIAKDVLLQHLAEQLKRIDPTIDGVNTLLAQVRAADLSQYLWLSREALATVECYARLAQSELKVDWIEAGDD